MRQLKSWCAEKGIGLKDVAPELDLTESRIYRLSSGNAVLTLEEYGRIINLITEKK